VISVAARFYLGQAYLMAGDRVRAKQSFENLVKFWKDADQDIPILKEAQEKLATL